MGSSSTAVIPRSLQVWDLLDHSRISPAPLRGDPGGRVPREPGDVHLVDHGRGKGPAQRRITLPIVFGGVDHDALHGGGSVLSPLACEVTAIGVRYDDGAPIGVYENLVWIETQAVRRIKRAAGTIGIHLPWADAGNEYVPVVVGAMCARIELDHARRTRGGRIIEQQEVHSGRLPRKHAEIDTVAEDGGAEREASAGLARDRLFQACRISVPEIA